MSVNSGKSFREVMPRLRLLAAVVMAVGTMALLPGAPLAQDGSAESLRMQLRAIHGFDRAALDAINANADTLLMQFAADTAESAMVRGQAIRGLALYDSAEVLAFLSDGAERATPVGLRALYITSLGPFAERAPEQLMPLLERLLADPEVQVRLGAANLAARMAPVARPGVDNLLGQALRLERDPHVRRALQQTLVR